jgi:hypothetical protein
LESTIAVAEQDRRTTPGVGHGQIELAVAIEVTAGERHRLLTSIDALSTLESTITVAEKNINPLLRRKSNSRGQDVRFPVSSEIRDSEKGWYRTGGQGGRQPETQEISTFKEF